MSRIQSSWYTSCGTSTAGMRGITSRKSSMSWIFMISKCVYGCARFGGRAKPSGTVNIAACSCDGIGMFAPPMRGDACAAMPEPPP